MSDTSLRDVISGQIGVTVDRGSTYAAGDAWGCVGRWFAGRWHTALADQYISTVQSNLNARIWETPSFQEP